PSFAGAHGALALAQAQGGDFQTQSRTPEAMKAIVALARRAVALDGSDAEASSLLCLTLRVCGDYESALAEAEKALAFAPNLASAHHEFGTTLIFSGRPEEGVAALEKSVRLDPRGPRSAARLNQIALGLYFCRDYLAAVEAAKRGIRSYPDFPNPYRWLAAA